MDDYLERELHGSACVRFGHVVDGAGNFAEIKSSPTDVHRRRLVGHPSFTGHFKNNEMTHGVISMDLKSVDGDIFTFELTLKALKCPYGD